VDYFNKIAEVVFVAVLIHMCTKMLTKPKII